MAYNKIILEKKNGIAKIILNRPDVLNAIDEELLSEFMEALGEVEKDDGVHVVILSGAGRAFSAGRDIKGIASGREKSAGSRFRVLENLSKPVIAAVHGYCFTGAFELVMCADIIVASEDAIFSDTHARFGLVPGAGQTQRLPRQIGAKKAKELLFTCDRISAGEAERIGIVNKVVPSDKLEDATMEMAAKILKNVPESVRMMKYLVNRGMKTDLETGLKMETELREGLISETEEGRKRIADIWAKNK